MSKTNIKDISATLEYRGHISLKEKLPALSKEYISRHQNEWRRFCIVNQLGNLSFEQVVTDLKKFLLPVINTLLAQRKIHRQWTSSEQKWS